MLEQEIGKIILREVDIPPGVLVTVLSVEATSDFKEAKVKISIFPFDKSELILEIFAKNIYHIQRVLNKKLRMKPVPRIYFRADATEEEASKVERLLGEEM